MRPAVTAIRIAANLAAIQRTEATAAQGVTCAMRDSRELLPSCGIRSAELSKSIRCNSDLQSAQRELSDLSAIRPFAAHASRNSECAAGFAHRDFRQERHVGKTAPVCDLLGTSEFPAMENEAVLSATAVDAHDLLDDEREWLGGAHPL